MREHLLLTKLTDVYSVVSPQILNFRFFIQIEGELLVIALKGLQKFSHLLLIFLKKVTVKAVLLRNSPVISEND